jgi:hypothetical protein
MSYIVVDENLQNVRTTNICDIVPTNRTGHIYLQHLLRVSVHYSNVELVNAFRINLAVKIINYIQDRISNIVSECS